MGGGNLLGIDLSLNVDSNLKVSIRGPISFRMGFIARRYFFCLFSIEGVMSEPFDGKFHYLFCFNPSLFAKLS